MLSTITLLHGNNVTEATIRSVLPHAHLSKHVVLQASLFLMDSNPSHRTRSSVWLTCPQTGMLEACLFPATTGVLALVCGGGGGVCDVCVCVCVCVCARARVRVYTVCWCVTLQLSSIPDPTERDVRCQPQKNKNRRSCGSRQLADPSACSRVSPHQVPPTTRKIAEMPREARWHRTHGSAARGRRRSWERRRWVTRCGDHGELGGNGLAR